MVNDAYHSDFSRDSSSSLRLFEQSIEEYAAVRVYKTQPPREPTTIMRQGTMQHCYSLERDQFFDRYILAPSGIDRRTKVGKEEWASFETSAAGKEVIGTEDMDACKAIHAGIMRNVKARLAMEAEGEVEKRFEWEHAGYGKEGVQVALKMRADKVTKTGLIIDLKVTDEITPDAWARKVANFAYHAQAACYLEGAGIAANVEGPFLWIVVSRTPPHECAVYTPDETALIVGQRRNWTTYGELADRRFRNDWTGRWADKIHTIQLPRWAS